MLALQPELAKYRAAHGKPWRHGGEQEAAMKIAHHIFTNLTLIGASREIVLGWLGPATHVRPTSTPDHEEWVYIRGTGEIASIYSLRLAGDTVTSVVEVPSQ